MNANIVKIGGRMASSTESVRRLAADILELREQSPETGWILVHGGGAEVSELTRTLGLEPRFRDGVRITSDREMDVVDMVLSGLVNKRLVRLFQSGGLPAVGLSGADGRIFSAKPVAERTGEVSRVDPGLLALLLGSGYLPILCSTSFDGTGAGLNVNADNIALAVAEAMQARSLVFLSDIPGVLKEGEVLGRLTPRDVEREIASGVISGGMVPKVKAAVGALAEGVREIIIGECTESDGLAALVSGRKGTRIVRGTQE